LVEISEETGRHVLIAEGTEEVYQGHPTTVLMPDGRTMFCTWCINHGGHCGPLARSDDGGLSWERVKTPDNWRSVYNCPSIYLLEDPDGVRRLHVFAARSDDEGVMQHSVSEDDGLTWSPFVGIGMPCIMAFTTMTRLKNGDYLGLYPRGKDDRDQSPLKMWQSTSKDGGLTWSEPSLFAEDEARGRDPDEPEFVRSPDGNQLLVLFRENLRKGHSLMVVSDDEGESWSDLCETPWGLTGDRHKACYAPDGRLVVVFRDMAPKSPSGGSFVAWVGRYEDVIAGRSGQFRIKLLHQHVEPGNSRQECDCGYPGLELLPDGTFVATTYVNYKPGPEKNSVVSVRFRLDEFD
tara:strand:+ start:9510 stop:10556 length:1047 start_codon:yes stop_codon:yes gene_type:complete